MSLLLCPYYEWKTNFHKHTKINTIQNRYKQIQSSSSSSSSACFSFPFVAPSVPLWKVVFAVFFLLYFYFISCTSNPTIKSISSSINIGISKALNNTLKKYRYTEEIPDFSSIILWQEGFNKKYTCKSLLKLGYHFVACSFFSYFVFFFSFFHLTCTNNLERFEWVGLLLLSNDFMDMHVFDGKTFRINDIETMVAIEKFLHNVHSLREYIECVFLCF